MLMGTRRLILLLILMTALAPRWADAQPACQKITPAMRGQTNVGIQTQKAIEACLRAQLEAATRLKPSARMKAVVGDFRAHRDNPANSAAFLDALRAAATAVAQTELARQDLEPMVGAGLAHGLFELGGTDSVPAWLVGVKSPVEAVRYLSARALASGPIQAAIQSTRDQPAAVVRALKQAGQVEQSAAVKRQMYRALSKLPFSADVYDAYLAMMDKSLERLRGGAVRIVGAELPVYRQLASPALRSAISNDQRVQLVARLGPLLHYTAARYVIPGLDQSDHEEFEAAERCLYFLDDALNTIVSGGGNLRRVMTTSGGASALKQEVVRWIGDAETKGVLNDPPYSLPAGAP